MSVYTRIAEFLKEEIGVDWEETFLIHDRRGFNYNCAFTGEKFDSGISLSAVIHDFETMEFIKIPYQPHIGEIYYMVHENGEISGEEWNGTIFDKMAKALGNVFKTDREADFHRDEIIKKLKCENER